MATDYVKSYTTPFFESATGSKKLGDLLWGDTVNTLNSTGERTKVQARGRTGYIKSSDLGGESLLEVYFIDVGQGDGVLVRTPDNRHIMIDGGYNRAKQPTKKNAADFIDWKFAKDYRKNKIKLEAMIASHCDADHYGGLWDLLNPDESDELDLSNVEVDHFYHAGVSWWKNPNTGRRYLGPIEDNYLTVLLRDRASVGRGLTGHAGSLELQGEWAEFLQVVHDHGCPVSRLSHVNSYLPGFEPNGNNASIKVLAPVEFELSGSPVLRSLGSTSQNSNGQSILLRLDYGRSRILLTGDLNKKSQRYLLEDYAGERNEFLCDVAKGCHHGSDDVSYEFLQAMGAAATVISSGDNESHAHPRPNIVAASALTGHVVTNDDELITPLIYSTEISRSIRLGSPTRLTHQDLLNESGDPIEITDFKNTSVEYKVTQAGDLNPRTRTKPFSERQIVDGIVYGLVNVRTNGDKILCAVLNEKKNSWDYQVFSSRF